MEKENGDYGKSQRKGSLPNILPEETKYFCVKFEKRAVARNEIRELDSEGDSKPLKGFEQVSNIIG